ncbi:hypothetical protein K8I28_03275 [bacterium]|nr:hypothetical protein [bacterium]
MAVRKRKRLLLLKTLRLLLAILDSVTVFSGFLLATWIHGHTAWFSEYDTIQIGDSTYLKLAVFSTLIFLLIFLWQGVYRPHANHLKLEFNRKLMRSIVMADAMMFIPFYYFQHNVDTRGVLTVCIILIPFLLLIQKSIIGALLTKQFDRPLTRRRLLILGHQRDDSALLRKAFSNWEPG